MKPKEAPLSLGSRRVFVWDTRFGTSYLALEVKCSDGVECLEKIGRAREVLSKLDRYPILSWSEYCGAFFLATRYAFPKEEINEFIRSLTSSGWEVVRYEDSSSNSNGIGNDVNELSSAEPSKGDR